MAAPTRFWGGPACPDGTPDADSQNWRSTFNICYIRIYTLYIIIYRRQRRIFCRVGNALPCSECLTHHSHITTITSCVWWNRLGDNQQQLEVLSGRLLWRCPISCQPWHPRDLARDYSFSRLYTMRALLHGDRRVWPPGKRVAL